MERHHKVIIGGFSTIVVVSIVAIAILLNATIVKQNLENAQLKNQISVLQNSTNQILVELSSNALNTKRSVEIINQSLISTNTQIDKLKIQTSEDLSGIIKDKINSIVIVRTLSSIGSGFFIADGYVVTNKHVLEDKSSGEISQAIQLVTHDNKAHNAVLVGYISNLDLALIKTDEGYSKLNLVNSRDVQVGERAIAIGTPEGLSFSATDGIVSAIERPGSNFGTQGTYVQTNAQLNPGNSGGPLMDKSGNVMGMNNFKLVNSEGIGFALEADKIKLGVNTISQKILNETLIN